MPPLIDSRLPDGRVERTVAVGLLPQSNELRHEIIGVNVRAKASIELLRPQPILCPESWWSSFHSPPSFTSNQTMWNRPVSVSFMELKSTVAVAVFPLTSFTPKELMLVLCIWEDSSPAIQLASSCWLLRVGP